MVDYKFKWKRQDGNTFKCKVVFYEGHLEPHPVSGEQWYVRDRILEEKEYSWDSTNEKEGIEILNDILSLEGEPISQQKNA